MVQGTDIVYNHHNHIGVAVATPTGLMVPVVRHCEAKSVADLEVEIAGYADRARNKRLKLEDLQGGGFTVTNGGVFGSLLATPMLNPPQSAIFGMHTIEKRPVVVDDEIVIRPMMYTALSYDHRIIDGKDAVGFLMHVRENLQNVTVADVERTAQ